jgi:hypothetical protein
MKAEPKPVAIAATRFVASGQFDNGKNETGRAKVLERKSKYPAKGSTKQEKYP